MALSVARELPSGIILAAAYVWISGLSLDLRASEGQVMLDVHPSPEAWTRQPAEQIQVILNESFPGGGRMSSLAELMARPRVAAAVQAIGEEIYLDIIQNHPDFAEAKEA